MANQHNLRPWVPGQSGNPAGKPKGSKHISTWIQELLNDEEFVSSPLDGGYKGAPIKAIVMAQIHLALAGNQKSFELLMKYGFAQSSEITSNSSNFLDAVVDQKRIYNL